MANRGGFGRAFRSVWLTLPLVALAAACRGQQPGLQEAELRGLIDSLLPEISRASGLEVREPVSFALQPRAEVREFIESQLAEELAPEELDGMARAYKLLGLLPDTLDLRALLLELYTEQVVGYYDPATQRLYVVEGVAREAAAPVVAHELVHALQDQLTSLDSLVSRERGNDRQLAAQAAAEGQATLVMVALQAAETTGRALDPAELPDLRELLRPALESENAQYPVFRDAPRLLRETLLFPYLGGAAFMQALYRARSVDAPPVPFGDLLPQSTEQVLSPERRFLDARDAPTELELGSAGAGWSVDFQNTLGQLETSILLAEHLDDNAASAAEGWDGDRYALLRGPGDRNALVWYSVWDDADAADRFAATYRRALAGQPARVGTVRRLEVAGRPLVHVVQLAADAGVDPEQVRPPAVAGVAETPVM